MAAFREAVLRRMAPAGSSGLEPALYPIEVRSPSRRPAGSDAVSRMLQWITVERPFRTREVAGSIPAAPIHTLDALRIPLNHAVQCVRDVRYVRWAAPLSAPRTRSVGLRL